MSFNRDLLPNPISYFDGLGLALKGRGKWRTTSCTFHGGSDSMRINIETGGFVCMAGCGAKGGDVLAYEMAHQGLDFIQTAKALGAWVYDGKFEPKSRPAPFTARAALEVLEYETLLVAGVASSIGQGLVLNESDRQRLFASAGRIQKIMGVFHAKL